MPDAVLEELFGFGDPAIVGWNKFVEAWIRKSEIPFVKRWRDNLKRWTWAIYTQALREQSVINDLAREAYANCTSGSVRIRAVIHPLIKGWMETKHEGAWNDREAIADTQKRHPKLFVNK